jgi:hypothetical protein
MPRARLASQKLNSAAMHATSGTPTIVEDISLGGRSGFSGFDPVADCFRSAANIPLILTY